MVEIAPAPNLSDGQLTKLYGFATAIFEELEYCGVGTVEFLVARDGNIYFLEVNPRLQVEHGVTELVTGIDLVEMQLRIAYGEALPISQEDVVIDGYALEARINAQRIDPGDPTNLVVTSGTVEEVKLPRGGNVRVDHAFVSGGTFNLEYNITQGKVMAKGHSYRRGIANLQSALKRTVIMGVETNIPLVLEILGDEEFRKGRHDTTFLPKLLRKLGSTESVREYKGKELAAAIGAAIAVALPDQAPRPPTGALDFSYWRYSGRREGLRAPLKKR